MSTYGEASGFAGKDPHIDNMNRQVQEALSTCTTTELRVLDEAPHGSDGIRLEYLLQADGLIVITYLHRGDVESGGMSAGMVSIFDVNSSGPSVLSEGIRGQLRDMFMVDSETSHKRQVICWPYPQRAGAEAAAMLDAFVYDLYSQTHTGLTGETSQATQDTGIVHST